MKWKILEQKHDALDDSAFEWEFSKPNGCVQKTVWQPVNETKEKPTTKKEKKNERKNWSSPKQATHSLEWSD